jgi:predicted nucleotidyltransferase
MNVVSNTQQLEQRINHFFTLSDEHQKVRGMLNALANNCPTWIFGGMVRDLGLFGPGGFSSDIDIVVNLPFNDLISLLPTLPTHSLRINKFGGVRFNYQNFEFDIWNLNETWAFREKHIACTGESSLLKTTLMSWDAVLFDLRSEKVLASENYINDLHCRHLELVLKTNPNPCGSVTKILRTIFTKQVKTLGPDICQFLQDELPKSRYEALHDYDIRHHKSSSFTQNHLDALTDLLTRKIDPNKHVSLAIP